VDAGVAEAHPRKRARHQHVGPCLDVFGVENGAAKVLADYLSKKKLAKIKN
jgi:hypothetical protein